MKAPRKHDRGYLAALHEMPCIICGSRAHIEAAHIRLLSEEWTHRTGVRTGAGGGEKPSDMWCLPLCVEHHRTGPDAEHVIGTRAFWKRHALDPHLIAHRLFSAFPDRAAMASVVAQVLVFGLGSTSKEQPA